MKTTILDGARCLLGESCNILNSTGIEYIIVGGWSPFLFNSKGYMHPGTKDVDVLFKKGTEPQELSNVITEFLKNGFIQSAKHPFQLLKAIEISNIDFAFNIDLLHPDNQEKKPDLFIDHSDFPVKESEVIDINYKGKTILLPKSDMFFDGLFEEYIDDFEMIDGQHKKVNFNLLNEAGLILSKLNSAFNIKRTRDIYDIYLAIENCRNYEAALSKLKLIINSNAIIKQSFVDFLDQKNYQLFTKNIDEWKANLNLWIPSWDATPTFTRFRNNLFN
jgi:hypothetical protein